jgi:hypothetical protein
MVRAVGLWVLTAALGIGVAAEAGPIPDSMTRLFGTVTDGEGRPLPGVSVKLFVEGLIVSTETTDEDGGFSISNGIDRQRDATVVVWWVAPRTDLVSEVALLRESRRDRELDLWGPCVPRIETPRMEPWVVRIRDRSSLREELIRSECAREHLVRPGTGRWYDGGVRG